MKKLDIEKYKEYLSDKEVDGKELIYQYIERLDSNKLPVIFDIKHMALILDVEYKKLLQYIFDNSESYHSITIPKKTGGERKIEIPSMPLKLIQTQILDNILENIEVSSYSCAFLKGKSIVDNAKKHVGKKYVVTLDLENFFTSISRERVFKIFYYYGYTKEVSFALSKIVTKEGYLPQGAPTSPYLSNIVCRKLDKRLGRLAECINCDYTRYADDITFSGNENLLEYVLLIRKIIEDEDFVINEKKMRIRNQYQRQEVTGLIVNNRIRVDKRYKQYLRQHIYYCNKFGIDNHLKQIGCTASGYKEHLYGLAYFIKMVEQTEGERWLHKLNELNWDY